MQWGGRVVEGEGELSRVRAGFPAYGVKFRFGVQVEFAELPFKGIQQRRADGLGGGPDRQEGRIQDGLGLIDRISTHLIQRGIGLGDDTQRIRDALAFGQRDIPVGGMVEAPGDLGHGRVADAVLLPAG